MNASTTPLRHVALQDVLDLLAPRSTSTSEPTPLTVLLGLRVQPEANEQGAPLTAHYIAEESAYGRLLHVVVGVEDREHVTVSTLTTAGAYLSTCKRRVCELNVELSATNARQKVTLALSAFWFAHARPCAGGYAWSAPRYPAEQERAVELLGELPGADVDDGLELLPLLVAVALGRASSDVLDDYLTPSDVDELFGPSCL